MRLSHKSKRVGDTPYALFKKGLVRQGFKHKISKRLHKMPDGKMSRPKRASKPLRMGLKYKNKSPKMGGCGCGCK